MLLLTEMPLEKGINMGLRFVGLLSFLLALSIFLHFLAVTPGYGNGAHIGEQEVFSGDVGEYFIRVTTIPIVGLMHLSIFMSHEDKMVPMQDIAITISAKQTDEKEGLVGPIEAIQSDTEQNWFGADIAIEKEGIWRFRLSLNEANTSEEITFDTYVRQPSRVYGPLFGLLGIGLVLGMLVMVKLFKRRRISSKMIYDRQKGHRH